MELEDQYPGLNHCLNEEYTPNRLKYFYEMFPAPGSADEPGLCELTEYLEEQNIPYAVASSSTRSDIMAFLAHAGRQLHPACILSGKEGFRSNPIRISFWQRPWSWESTRRRRLSWRIQPMG